MAKRKLEKLISPVISAELRRVIVSSIENSFPGLRVDGEFSLGSVEVPYEVEPCEDLCLMLDTGHVLFEDWGDFVCQGAKEVLKERIGKQGYCSVVNFGDMTEISKWVENDRTKELYPLVASIKKGAAMFSTLDVDAVSRLLDRERRSAILMVSPGEINERDRVIEMLSKMPRKGNVIGFVYLNPGRSLSKPEFVYALEDEGCVETIYDVGYRQGIANVVRGFASRCLTRE